LCDATCCPGRGSYSSSEEDDDDDKGKASLVGKRKPNFSTGMGDSSQAVGSKAEREAMLLGGFQEQQGGNKKRKKRKRTANSGEG